MNTRNLKEAVENSGLGKRILIWGACKKNDSIKELLYSWGFSVYGYIDRNHEREGEYDGLKVFGREILAETRFFVYVGLTATYPEIFDTMHQYGYLEFKDFWYPSRQVVLDGTESYTDSYGNSLNLRSSNTPLKVILRDGGKVVLGNCKFDKSCIVAAEIGAEILIDDESKFERDCKISSIGSDSIIKIGKNCIIDWGCLLQALCGGKFEMQDNCTLNRFCVISASMNATVILGEDCMFSYYVLIRAGNSHNIFDLELEENLDRNDRRNVFLGDHVWVGMRATIFSGAEIGAGSVVGANSFVNKKFPLNCSIAGSPARIIRKKVAWLRTGNRLYDSYEDFSEFDFMTR